MAQVYRVDSPNIMHESIDDEVVVVNLDTGTYYSFDGVGAEIWEYLSGEGCALDTLVETICARFEGDVDEIREHVQSFIGELHAEGLINSASGDGISSPSSGEPVGKFMAPTLQKFTDMEALLLADPIHEVQDDGWPHLKE